MKLYYRTDFCLFVMFCALLVNSVSTESELLTKELIDVIKFPQFLKINRIFTLSNLDQDKLITKQG